MGTTNHSHSHGRTDIDRGPIPFPVDFAARRLAVTRGHAPGAPRLSESVDDVLSAFDTMSRRINDLARELNCLGHFDDPNSDLPRAA